MDHLNVTHVVGPMLPGPDFGPLPSRPALLAVWSPSQAAFGARTWSKCVSERYVLNTAVFKLKKITVYKRKPQQNKTWFILFYDSRRGRC